MYSRQYLVVNIYCVVESGRQISGLEEFDYYLIKLGNSPYSSAELEMSYYELATMAGINMMPFSSNSYNT